MRPKRAALAAAALALASSPAIADCTCRAPGIVVHHGQTICLKTPSGPRLARCEMVLNNSSWKILPESCPEVSLERQDNYVAMSVAPPDASVVR
jgi:hypothetical protein